MSTDAGPIAGRGATTIEPARAPARYPTFRPRHSWAWWQRNRNYQIYMLREISAVFCAIWAITQIVQLNRLNQGERQYQRFVRTQRNPGWVFFNLVGYGFMWLHAFTWWKLLGSLDIVKIGDRKAGGEKVTAGAFGLWGLVSAVLAMVLLLGGRRR